GALGSVEMVDAVAEMAASFHFPLVVDPVLISKHGNPLLAEEAIERVRTRLLPHARLVTPNIPEAEALTGIRISSPADLVRAAKALADCGARAVLIKGGHSSGDAVDLLFDGVDFHHFPAPRIPTSNTHGTGCTYSAAITALLARGVDLVSAVGTAKKFIHQAIQTNPG